VIIPALARMQSTFPIKEKNMRKTFYFIILAVLLCSTALTNAGLLDNVMKETGMSSKSDKDDSKIASGLKEALSIGTKKAVNNVSQVNGYFGNQAIKILMPEKIQKVADVLRKVGYQKEVDDFVLSMNRAAETAAPKATSFFVDAIKEMTFEDARGILNGGDTSATEFFKNKTHDKIYNAFKPVVSSSMDKVGVTHSYKEMMGKYESLPFMSKQSMDLDHYVTTKAMDGLFYMVGQEEKKIRTDPAARVTDLLKSVFGK
jgi:RNA binding exosome subunit